MCIPFVPTIKTKFDKWEELGVTALMEYIHEKPIGYERIVGSCVPYFDFDNQYDDDDEREAKEDGDYNRAFDAVQNEYPKGRIYMLQSCGLDSSKGVYKNSYHAIVRGVGYFDCGKDLYDSLGDGLKAVADKSVYKPLDKRQLFRMPFCSKEADDRPLVYYDHIDDALYEDIKDLDPSIFAKLIASNIDGEKLVETPVTAAHVIAPKQRVDIVDIVEQDKEQNENVFKSLNIDEYFAFVKKCISKIMDNTTSNGWGNNTRLKFVFSSKQIALKYGIDVRDLVEKSLTVYSKNCDADEVKGLMDSYDNHDDDDKNYTCASFFELAATGNSKRYKNLRKCVYERIENELYDSDEELEELDELEFDVFRDYRKLLALYKTTDHAIDVGVGLKWINSTIVCIANGGKSMYMTKNKRTTDDGNDEFYYETVSLNTLRASVKKVCRFKGLVKCTSFPKGRCETLSELILYAELIDAIPNFNNVDFIPYLNNKPKLHDTFNIFGGYPLKIAIDQQHDEVTSDLFVNSGLYKHIRDEICDENSTIFTWINRWVGHIIQRPTKRTGFMPIICSEQGGGKDLTGHLFAKLVGENHSLMFNTMSSFMQKHNTEQCGRLLIRLNEISDRASGKTDHNQLKSKVDEKKIRIEPKGVDSYYVSNYANYIGFSNFKDSMFIENSDRRYVCIMANSRKCNDKAYFAPLWDELDDNELLKSAFVYYSNLDIDTFLQEHIPTTDYKREQKLQNLSNVYRFIIDKINEDQSDYVIASNLVYSEYERFCVDVGEKSVMLKTFASKLKEIGYVAKASRKFGKVKKVYSFDIDGFQTAMQKHLHDDKFVLMDEE